MATCVVLQHSPHIQWSVIKSLENLFDSLCSVYCIVSQFGYVCNQMEVLLLQSGSFVYLVIVLARINTEVFALKPFLLNGTDYLDNTSCQEVTSAVFSKISS